MQLSVIILNYNVRYFLELCVQSVIDAIANIDAEIIVVDNDSPDDSCEMMQQRFPNIKLIRNTENAGFPKGNNIGVAAAKGDYLCILNPDTVVAEDTFKKVLAFAEATRDHGIIGVKLIDGAGHFLPESKRGTPTPWVAFTKISGLYKIAPKLFGQYYAQHLKENQTGPTDILVGAFMVMKRQLYLDVGGFDENCFMYSDDIDLSYSVLKSGKQNYYYAGTTVIHYKGESTVRDATYMKRFRDAMNYFYAKHFRVSRAFDIFMNAGGVFFTLMKRKQGIVRKAKIDNYILVSDDQNLHRQVENLLGKKVGLESPALHNALYSFVSQPGNTQIIFDNNEIKFKTIIEMMWQFKSRNVTYRIIPKKSAFLIGSDNSNDRGQILKL